MMKTKNVSRETLKSCTLPAIAGIKGAYYIFNRNERDYDAYCAMEIKRFTRGGYNHKRSATHNGYLPPHYVAVIPYRGRWGIGYIMASHLSNNKVRYEYYIKG